ncbi:MAG: thrombospondin type 3 repeat-containing protein [Gammaproteobacteria bacterium]
MKTKLKLSTIACGLFFIGLTSGSQAETPNLAPIVEDVAKPISARQLELGCAMLNDPEALKVMDGLKNKLLIQCGRGDELRNAKPKRVKPTVSREPRTDTLVNDPTGEFSDSQTQSETSLARNEITGTLCSGFNDSFSAENTSGGIVGFSRSTDDGLTFVDGGDLSPNTLGDPSVVWRRLDGHFYFASIHFNGLGLWRSTDDCGTFDFIGLIHEGGFDDKEIMTVDNNPGSPFYGRLQVSWLDFIKGRRIYNTFSADGGATWSSPTVLSEESITVQGAWPAIAPNGDVYVAWSSFEDPVFSTPISRSTDGGVTFTPVTTPMENQIRPRDAAASSFCFQRPSLKGNIRYLASPQMVVAPNGDLAVVYSYDPDGLDTGDVVDVFFRLSKDQGSTWEPEIKLNDDSTLNDQYFPTLSVGPTGRFVATWYDKRHDENNVQFDYYSRSSSDGGVTWFPSVRLSDESSPIYLDPKLARCYHGDYDQNVQSEAAAYIQWSDDRAIREGRNDPDVYLDKNTLGPDFFVSSDESIATVCAPDAPQYTINVFQAEGFTDPITLSASGLPDGTVEGFSVNPVSPGGTSVFSINVAGTPEFGSYSVDVNGTDGTSLRSAQVDYNLFTAIPAVPLQVEPANGAIDQSIMPTLSWEPVPQTTTYSIEIASDMAFSNIVESGTSNTNSYSVVGILDFESTFYWRVRAANICGSSVDSAVFEFETNRAVCSDAGFDIENNDTVSETIEVFDSSIIDSLTVDIDVSHNWVGDMTFRLVNETTNTTVVLMDRPGHPEVNFGCSSDDIVAKFDDSSNVLVETECNSTSPAIGGVVKPEGSLSDFNGATFGGTWRLEAQDSTSGSDGNVVNSWCITAVVTEVETDTDSDGVVDSQDNCTLIANSDQRDTNGDGFGNACDPDLDNNGVVNFADVAAWTPLFNTACGDVDADFNGDGACNFADYALFAQYFLVAPGPAAETQPQ